MRAPTAQNKVISCLRTCNQIQLPATLRFAEIWRKMLTDCLADAKSKAEWYHLTGFINILDGEVATTNAKFEDK